MKTLLVVAALAAAPLAALGWIQDKKAVPASSTDDPMAKMMQLGSPGPAHEVLRNRVGNWTFDMKMYMPGSPEPMPMNGTMKVESIMDGRFVQENVTSSFMGEAFQGRGTTGYDNIKQKYVSTWIDNMGTGIMMSEGTYDAATMTYKYSGESPDMMTGKYVKSRWTETWTDKDHFTGKGYKTGPDGKEFLEMEMTYTRSK